MFLQGAVAYETKDSLKEMLKIFSEPLASYTLCYLIVRSKSQQS